MTSEEYSAWASFLMVGGKDTSEIIDLAANPHLHWQEFEPLVKRIFSQVGLFSRDQPREQALQLMNMLIADWEQGLIDYRELADKGRKIYYRSDHLPELSFWIYLDSDIGMIEGGEYPIFFGPMWDRSDLPESFRAILRSQYHPEITTPLAP